MIYTAVLILVCERSFQALKNGLMLKEKTEKKVKFNRIIKALFLIQ